MGEHGAAGDACQEAFISAYQKLEQYRGGSFKAWLLRIATNACYDELRRRQRQPVTPLTPELDDGEVLEDPYWIEDEQASPEEQTEQAELEKAIQHCISKLEEKFQIILVLVDIEGMDYETASEIAHTPPGDGQESPGPRPVPRAELLAGLLGTFTRNLSSTKRGRMMINERQRVRVLEQLSAFLDGEINEAEQKQIESRLASEPELHEMYEGLRKTKLLFGRLRRLRAPRSFALTPEMVKVRKQKKPFFIGVRWATSVAAILLVVVFGAEYLLGNMFTASAPMAAEPVFESMEMEQDANTLAEDQPNSKAAEPEPLIIWAYRVTLVAEVMWPMALAAALEKPASVNQAPSIPPVVAQCLLMRCLLMRYLLWR